MSIGAKTEDIRDEELKYRVSLTCLGPRGCFAIPKNKYAQFKSMFFQKSTDGIFWEWTIKIFHTEIHLPLPIIDQTALKSISMLLSLR